METHHTLENILPLLECKKDGGQFNQKGKVLKCEQCGATVNLIEGRIPDFIQQKEGYTSEGLSFLTRKDRSAFWRFLYNHLPRPQMVIVRKKEQQLVNEFIRSVPEDQLILNVGSGNIDYGPRVVNVDIVPGDYVDVVASAHDLPFHTGHFGGVMSLAVLEHVEHLKETLAEINRLLRDGGNIFHAIPFMQPAHGVPRDYRRFTLKGIETLFSNYTMYKSGLVNGPGSAIAWCLREYFSIATSFGSTFLYNVGMYIWGWIFTPLKFTDYLLTDSRFASQLASGVYFWGTKQKKD